MKILAIGFIGFFAKWYRDGSMSLDIVSALL